MNPSVTTSAPDSSSPASVGRALDRLETRLPLLPRRVLRLQRSIFGAGIGISRTILKALGVSAGRVGTSAEVGAKTVAGQARAEAKQTADTASDEVASGLGRLERAVEGDDAARLEDWTKAELYDRAQQLDIDGRSTMSKAELIEALRAR